MIPAWGYFIGGVFIGVLISAVALLIAELSTRKRGG
jgi:gas vesicle protein